MANTRGVFTLQDVRYAQEDEVWVSLEQAFAGVPQGFDTGYNTGGNIPSVSITDKTNYTTDTTARVPGADLNTGARQGLEGCGSITAGYYAGGPGSDTVNKLSYSTETMTTVPGTLNVARGYLSACSNEQAGYWSGGAPGSNSSTDKCTFSTDTVARAPSANLSVARAFVHACSSKSAGYIGNGFLSPNYYSTVDKLSFGGDYLANVSTLANSVASEDNNASGNNQFGYFTGGFGPGSTVHSRVDKVNYTAEVTLRIPTADLTTAVFKHGQTGTAFAGYASGGQTPSRISTTQKLNYSTETATTVPGAALSGVRSDMGTSSSRDSGLPTLTQPNNLKSKASFGYGLIGGGPLPSGRSSIYKIDYSTDVAAYGGNTTANMGSKGSGGGTQNEAYLSHSSTTNKIPYATLTATAVPSAALNASTYYCGQVSSERAMYVHGGNPTPLRTVIQKLTYATDTAETLSNNLVDGIQWPYNFSNLSVGYAAGRSNAPDTSIIQKITFASETCNLLTSTLANTGASSSGGSGFDAGYTIQGSPSGRTNVGKFTYATETHADIPRMFTQTAMNEGGCTGHGGAGYYMMGYTGATGYVTTTTKTNYVTETSSRVPGANSTFANRDCFDTSSQDFNFPQPRPETPTPTTLFPNAPNTGYWVGGEAPRVSNVDKIEYASETVSRSTYGLPELRNGFDGTGNTEKAFYLGGFHPGGPGATSNVQKLVYATDVFSAAPNLNERRYFAAVTGDLDTGYTSGGAVPASSSRTEKITFSTESTSLVPGANLSATRYSMGGVSNQTSGYALGGAESGSYFSRVDKITFSSETFAYTPGANLSVAKGLVASTGNASVALLIGGATASKVSDADKLTFSTDTTSAVPSANLPTATGNCSGSLTGNGLNGYFAGGNDGSGTSAMYKTSFFTETTQYAPGRLSFARWNLASSSALESNQVTGVAPLL